MSSAARWDKGAQFSPIPTPYVAIDRTGPIAGTEMGQYGPFRAVRCQFLDERERTEARSVYARAQMIRVAASAQTDRQIWTSGTKAFGVVGPVAGRTVTNARRVGRVGWGG